MKYFGFAVALVILIMFVVIRYIDGDKSDAIHDRLKADTADKDRRIDSLSNRLQFVTDSLSRSSEAWRLYADSINTLPRKHYADHADRLTRNASLDSLGVLFWTAPFVAVPDTLDDHHEP